MPTVMMTTREAAYVIGVTENTLRQSRVTRRLHGRPAPPFYRYGHRTVKYHRDELDQWKSGQDYPSAVLTAHAGREAMKEAPPSINELNAGTDVKPPTLPLVASKR